MAEVARGRIPLDHRVEPSIRRQGQLQPQVNGMPRKGIHYFNKNSVMELHPRTSWISTRGKEAGSFLENLKSASCFRLALKSSSLIHARGRAGGSLNAFCRGGPKENNDCEQAVVSGACAPLPGSAIWLGFLAAALTGLCARGAATDSRARRATQMSALTEPNPTEIPWLKTFSRPISPAEQALFVSLGQ